MIPRGAIGATSTLDRVTGKKTFLRSHSSGVSLKRASAGGCATLRLRQLKLPDANVAPAGKRHHTRQSGGAKHEPPARCDDAGGAEIGGRCRASIYVQGVEAVSQRSCISSVGKAIRGPSLYSPRTFL